MIKASDLYELTVLNIDGVNGFLMQAASGLTTSMVLWPDHLTGKRWEAFKAGSDLARRWLTVRRGYAISRRKHRIADFKEQGATECILPRGADRRREQLECLRSVLAGHPLAKATGGQS